MIKKCLTENSFFRFKILNPNFKILNNNENKKHVGLWEVKSRPTAQ